MVVAQIKGGRYHDLHLMDAFFSFVVKVFVCLHQQMKVFLNLLFVLVFHRFFFMIHFCD
jgi:hypothetical protein